MLDFQEALKNATILEIAVALYRKENFLGIESIRGATYEEQTVQHVDFIETRQGGSEFKVELKAGTYYTKAIPKYGKEIIPVEFDVNYYDARMNFLRKGTSSLYGNSDLMYYYDTEAKKLFGFYTKLMRTEFEVGKLRNVMTFTVVNRERSGGFSAPKSFECPVEYTNILEGIELPLERAVEVYRATVEQGKPWTI